MNLHNAKYAFYYILSLVALVFVAISVGMVSFQAINKFLPDALGVDGGVFSSEILRFAISALLVAAPIFYTLSSLIIKGLKRGELSREAGVRRWLTYFIILVSSLVAVGALIAMVNNFLSGETTGRSILKMLTIMFLGAVAFVFYLYDIRRKEVKEKSLVTRIFFFASLVIVLVAFVSALFLVESPKVARAKRLDQILTNNLNTVNNAVNSYYDQKQKLPDTLTQLQSDPTLFLTLDQSLDPETKAPIEYRKLSDKEFEFCATFRTDNTKEQNGLNYAGTLGLHHAGRDCLKGSLWSQVKPTSAIVK